ncbi:MAG: DUF1836 domain-containing protein [Peptoniphilus lacrimalis]
MINKAILDYAKSLENTHISRWDELPDFDLYATQVVDFIKKELFFLNIFGEDFVTKSMLNNYVKNKMIPRPNNKKYNKEALAKLIAITLLKQIMEIPDVCKGIFFQVQNSGTMELAYNTFCQEFEDGINLIFKEMPTEKDPIDLCIKNVEKSRIITHLASVALASKLMVKKVVDSGGFLVKEDTYE